MNQVVKITELIKTKSVVMSIKCAKLSRISLRCR